MMNEVKRLVQNRWWLAAGLLVGSIAVSNACGPFFSEAVFVKGSGPDGSYAEYVKGRIGVPQPGYRIRHLVVAYDWLNGRGLSPLEQQQAIALEAELDPPPQTFPNQPSSTTPMSVQWAEARTVVGVPQESEAQTDKQDHTPTAVDRIAEARMRNDMAEFAAERPVPGQPYSYFINCLEDAFGTAVKTMAARKSEHGSDAASFAEWVHGQDTVFRNCNGQEDAMPAAVGAGAPQWLQNDRAYQRAAASFYQMDYDAAITQLRAIAANGHSPWNKAAWLVMARAMIRRGTVGQITDMDPSARRAPMPGTPFDPKQNALLQTYERTLAERRVGRLREASTALTTILSDPSMEEFHHSASGLLDMVHLKVDPAAQALVLEQRLTSANRAQTPGMFRQALIDLGYYSDGALPGPPDTVAGPQRMQPVRPDVLGFIRTMRREESQQREYGYVSDQQVAPEPKILLQGKQDALSTWRSTHETAWLLAALTASDPGDTETPQLLAAARSLPVSSPGAVAATYYRLRLTGGAGDTRAELDRLLPAVDRTESRSTANLFRMLRQQSAPTLAAFLNDAGLGPAAETDDADPESDLSTQAKDGLCHVQASDADTLLFTHDAATVLNTRMPLELLAQAAKYTGLEPNLRFQIAQATWTRAVLLGQPMVAKQMDTILSGCYPAWKPVLARYDAAESPMDRQAEGLLALMRFASTEPIVREGMQRPEGFATYSNYRDNWWEGSRDADAVPAGDVHTLGTFFGAKPAPVKELPDPQWLTAAEREEAAREVAALRTVPCASDYFAAAALHWQEQHPGDARTADILGSAERVARSGCRTDATKDLNHRLFVVVQTKYPKSEWATKYKTWE